MSIDVLDQNKEGGKKRNNKAKNKNKKSLPHTKNNNRNTVPNSHYKGSKWLGWKKISKKGGMQYFLYLNYFWNSFHVHGLLEICLAAVEATLVRVLFLLTRKPSTANRSLSRMGTCLLIDKKKVLYGFGKWHFSRSLFSLNAPWPKKVMNYTCALYTLVFYTALSSS